jgi:glycosyltransferase involved in cell wall biosynthesis
VRKSKTVVDVVIPVYNEELILTRSITTLWNFLRRNEHFDWTIVIADNASTDNTLDKAQALSRELSNVSYVHIAQKGRGRALRRGWLQSTADIVSYMDVDLSTSLTDFPQLIGAIEDGYDIAIGSRLLPASRVKRSLKREITSRGYNLLTRAMFSTKFRDAQCGFKALDRRAAWKLVPLVQNQEWFFDSELLILAEREGYRIKEIPVKWTEDPDSKVDVFRTALEDFRGLIRLRFSRSP